MTKQLKWDTRFLRLAEHISTWSQDPSTQAGAVIVGPDRRVISLGFNGFPKGMADLPSRLADREDKYSRTIHCEVNALIFAGRQLPAGSSLYVWPFMPCDRCAVQMLQAGIRRFISPKPSADALTRWSDAFEKTKSYVHEVGGTISEIDLQ